MSKKLTLWAPPGGGASKRKEIEKVAAGGGLAVYDVAALERAGMQRIIGWPTDESGQPVQPPPSPLHWDCRGRTPTFFALDDVEVREESGPATLARSYMDLETFLAAVEALRGRYVMGGDPDIITDATLDGEKVSPQDVEDGGHRVLGVVLRTSRTAMNGNGSIVGDEEYEVLLPVVPAEGDIIPGPATRRFNRRLPQWLVQVDESAASVEMVSHPPETEVEEGWFDPETDEFVEGEEPPDDDDPGACWERAHRVDGETHKGDVEESFLDGGYYPPDDDFVDQEGIAYLENILRVGAHWEFDADARRWACVDARGRELGPEVQL